jgi:3,4-dihydroxy 2-butanone 4-phosphate synthase/GTP cyclohydrolase II
MKHTTASVKCVARASMPTWLGDFEVAGYESLLDGEQFLALVKGQIDGGTDVLARIHSQCVTSEVFGSTRCDCALQLDAAIRLIQQHGRGVVVYQFQEGRGIGLLNKIRAYALQDRGADTIDADACLGFDGDRREFSQCAEILLDLGVRGVRFMSNNPKKIEAVCEAGLVLVERLSPPIPIPAAAIRYLQTKKERMGHFIEYLESFTVNEPS